MSVATMTTVAEPFTGHNGAVRAIAVFTDERRIVTGGDDQRIGVWELRSGRLLAWHAEHEDEVLAVATTEDQRIVSCGRTKTVISDGTTPGLSINPHDTPVTEAAISPHGDAVAAIDPSGTILQPMNGLKWPSGHRRVDDLTVTEQGEIITVGAEPAVRMTDRAGAEVDRLDGDATGGVAVATSADGSQIVVVDSGAVWYWNRRRREGRVRLPGCDDAVTVAVTPDGRQVVAGGLGGGICAWDLDAQTVEPMRMHGHDHAVRAFAVTPDGLQLISGAEDGTIRAWDLLTGGEITPGRPTRPRPKLENDQESAEDKLGFAEDVDSVAALITDRGTEPPLAIALLGRWGSGKSSFIRQLQDSVKGLAERGDKNPARSVFATAVHQVRFDAWHYNEDHLWIGIVEHLFTVLAETAQANTQGLHANRETLEEKLRDLEVLADTKAPATRRLRARLRLWSASLPPWRARIPLVGAVTVLLGAVTGLTWWLWRMPVVTAIFGLITAGAPVVTAVAPVVPRVIAAWPRSVASPSVVPGTSTRRCGIPRWIWPSWTPRSDCRL